MSTNAVQNESCLCRRSDSRYSETKREYISELFVRSRNRTGFSEIQAHLTRIDHISSTQSLSSIRIAKRNATMLTTALASSILYLLTRCPSALEPYVQRILAHVPAQLAINRPILITLLKVIVSLGLIHNTSSYLTSVALNNWQWRSDKHKWEWSKEVAVVTGGCSGIGEEIVKGLARRGVKVVVLDVQEMPERLKDGMFRAHRLSLLCY